MVNEKIWESIDVEISQKAIEEAKEMGAMALFGENTVMLYALYKLAITA